MAELGGDSQSGELKDLIEHWVQVIDNWVDQLDEGMGGTGPKGADPAEACDRDPSPRPAQGTAPAFGTG